MSLIINKNESFNFINKYIDLLERKQHLLFFPKRPGYHRFKTHLLIKIIVSARHICGPKGFILRYNSDNAAEAIPVRRYSGTTQNGSR